jgi:hypothetical protein
VGRIRAGDLFDERTNFGPLVSFPHRDNVPFAGTNTRVPLVHTWPELKKLAIMAMSAARSRSGV